MLWEEESLIVESRRLIGKEIRKARMRRFTETEFSSLLGYSQQHISRIERGISPLRVDLFLEICLLLEVSPHSIIEKCLCEAISFTK
ncbi:Helix-turn-helix [Izhakiella capsodis]|uniref:Helix-turn-helix n=1 Tax=Izhakiella capsodis TaxID=1367852 RepID=A0A1I4YJL4_9GAMM|nr:Helix-turn-helix [Izhakiella capsodis]